MRIMECEKADENTQRERKECDCLQLSETPLKICPFNLFAAPKRHSFIAKLRIRLDNIDWINEIPVVCSCDDNNENEIIEEAIVPVIFQVPRIINCSHRRRPYQRRYIERNRVTGHENLYNDYFSPNPTYPPNLFRRIFRMYQHVFLRLVKAAEAYETFFAPGPNGSGRVPITSLQKCTAALRMLAYRKGADRTDEYCRLGESTTFVALEKFTEAVIDAFGAEYLRSPNANDLQRLLQIGAHRGFPGMMGRFCNDLTVLHRFPIFDDMMNVRAPRVNYMVNEKHYNTRYYLTDGIYPQWTTFIQSIPLPETPKDRLFAERQEAARKDVERAFGVLQARFAVIRKPALTWSEQLMRKILKCCVIIHNMVVEDERDTYANYSDPTEFDNYGNEEGHLNVEDPEYEVGYIAPITAYIQNRNRIRNARAHQVLRADLIENIWQKFGDLN
ncbi:uncharacterized protein LOC141651413 [Silene latifolia]|uniref:uncharacterized protein LOC141651413 n=1 Tax=Silene latifolia TaxID=37657 RepID=UPI003D782A60